MSIIIAYIYDSALHCPDCARERFGSRLVEGDTRDCEGNPVRPVFSTDEVCDPNEVCEDCWTPIHK